MNKLSTRNNQAIPSKTSTSKTKVDYMANISCQALVFSKNNKSLKHLPSHLVIPVSSTKLRQDTKFPLEVMVRHHPPSWALGSKMDPQVTFCGSKFQIKKQVSHEKNPFTFHEILVG